ncbi:acyl-CoA/acyl-ACP dehydrogenase [Yinghuangia sp. ASG 101]|uniref:acyl-CoA dehydrogenase family protein n=1 Tax=Yinghuangia sp. ASG 101 TaxID=2896848 RepID=UPI001E2D8E58|nr:acyl-CoA dehydrogenase family protein [Yinghuangia sp. ASG 101]UGQ11439.1 acyl-CoA/acyl-ACP dehydrogenase [Yinghuangia sp. ASG 101]
MSDLTMLRESVRSALAVLSPMAEVRRLMATDDGFERRTWHRLCRELDLVGLAVPETYGGAGYSAVESGVAFEEAGRSLLCAPLFSTAGLAVPLLLALDDADANGTYLPGLCDGSTTATVVVADADGRSVFDGADDAKPVTALGTTDTVLAGTAGFVVDGATADLVLVPAQTPGGVGLFAVRGNAPGLTRTALVTLDQTRRQARLVFDRVPATRIGGGDAAAAVGTALDVARALLAAEQAGGAARCLAETVEYAKTRVQFGRSIGSFQAIKQRAADLLIKVESCRSAALAATQAAAEALRQPVPEEARIPDLPELAVAASVARVYGADACVAVAAEAIQLHGGIGFTWEHDAHLYFKRAWSGREMLGRPEQHTRRLAALLGDVA